MLTTSGANMERIKKNISKKQTFLYSPHSTITNACL